MGSRFLALFTACTRYHWKELKAVLKVGEQDEQSDAVNKTSMESTAQDDDFQEVKRRKRRIPNNTSQTAKKWTNQSRHPQLSSCLQKQCQPATSSHLSELLTWTQRLPEQEALRKSGRPPEILRTSTTNLIRRQSDLKEHVKRVYEFRNTGNGTNYHNKRNGELFSHEIPPGEK
jgi:hypothetical protein